MIGLAWLGAGQEAPGSLDDGPRAMYRRRASRTSQRAPADESTVRFLDLAEVRRFLYALRA